MLPERAKYNGVKSSLVAEDEWSITTDCKMSALISDLIRQSVALLLKEHGFVKKGNTWNRRLREVVHVIDLQESRYDDNRRVRFTLNVGVASPEAYAICWGPSVPSFLQETDCILRKRVGEFLNLTDGSMALDYWWKLSSAGDVTIIGKEVATAIRVRLLPYLDGISSTEALYAVLAKQVQPSDVLGQIYLAILTALQGEAEKAKDALDVAAQAANAAWRTRIAQVREQLTKAL